MTTASASAASSLPSLPSPHCGGLSPTVVNAGAWELSPDFSLWVSSSAANVLGLGQSSLTISLKGLLSLSPAEDRDPLGDLFESAMGGRSELHACQRILRADGAHGYLIHHASIQNDQATGGPRLHGCVVNPSWPSPIMDGSSAPGLQATLASIEDAFLVFDFNWRLAYLNPPAERLLGVSQASVIGRDGWGLFPSLAKTKFPQELRRAMAERVPISVEDYIPLACRWFEARIHPTPSGLAVHIHDVTERHEGREQLSLLKSAMERANDIITISEIPSPHGGGRVIFVNEAYERLTGRRRENILGRFASEQPCLPHALMQHENSTSPPPRSEMQCASASGSPLWLEVDISPLFDPAGSLTHWVSVQRDITERKQSEEKIQQLAFFDTLTKLPNRAMLMERLAHALAESERSGNDGALLFIDFDNFKALNDTLGHDKGDLMLCEAARRLQLAAPEPDLVARLGGDEFVVLLEQLPADPMKAAAKVNSFAEAILRALGAPYNLDETTRHIGASIGVTLFAGHRHSLGELLKRADMAMYQAKTSGGNALRFFDPQMQAAMRARDGLESELREALASAELELFYQPQVSAKGRLLGAEALSRWIRNGRQHASPGRFISLAEDTGLIFALGQWAMRSACERLAFWAKNPATADLTLSVNVSAREFHRPEFAAAAIECLASTGANPRLLKLELTESILVEDMEIAFEKMKLLLSHGLRFCLDDFGTGYSSLSYLKRLPLSQIKIDQTFVRDAITQPADAAIARSIIALCDSLGLDAIAEGVETEAQRHFLLSAGCTLYQGYLFGAPMPAAEFEALAQAWPAEQDFG